MSTLLNTNGIMNLPYIYNTRHITDDIFSQRSYIILYI